MLMARLYLDQSAAMHGLRRLLLLAVMAWRPSGAYDAMFMKTQNISTSNFNYYTKKSLKATSLLDCASKCIYWEDQASKCNAFRWPAQEESVMLIHSYSYINSSTECKLAKLTYLENPSPNNDAKQIFVELQSTDTLPMKCRWPT
jgi:hypothetical protein